MFSRVCCEGNRLCLLLDYLDYLDYLTILRIESTKQIVPDRPIPALQWTTIGPKSSPITPDWRIVRRNAKNGSGDLGTPKSGHAR